jgi:hypothetical protein
MITPNITIPAAQARRTWVSIMGAFGRFKTEVSLSVWKLVCATQPQATNRRAIITRVIKKKLCFSICPGISFLYRKRNKKIKVWALNPVIQMIMGKVRANKTFVYISLISGVSVIIKLPVRKINPVSNKAIHHTFDCPSRFVKRSIVFSTITGFAQDTRKNHTEAKIAIMMPITAINLINENPAITEPDWEILVISNAKARIPQNIAPPK